MYLTIYGTQIKPVEINDIPELFQQDILVGQSRAAQHFVS
jgi:hypothetical protein